jgi:hypothetical protein
MVEYINKWDFFRVGQARQGSISTKQDASAESLNKAICLSNRRVGGGGKRQKGKSQGKYGTG